jgi:hypothetical protein
MKKYLRLCFCIAIVLMSQGSWAQNMIAELDLGKSVIEGATAGALNDSLFIGLEGLRTATTHKRNFYWVRADGSTRAVPLELSKNQFIFAAGYAHDEEYYYYPVEIKSKVFLRAIILDKKTGTLREGDQEVEIAGTPYGSYMDNGTLCLLTAEKKTYTMVLARIAGLKVESRQEFNLSFDLGSLSTMEAKFRLADTEFIPSNSFSAITITKYADAIWISADEPGKYNKPQPAGTLYKTTVIKLDLIDPAKSFVKSFFETRLVYFSSKIVNGLLFRSYFDFDLRTNTVDVFEIESTKKIFSQTFSNKSDFAETHYYLRDANNTVQKDLTTKPFRLGASLANVSSISENEYLLVIGAALPYQPYVPLMTNWGIVGALLSVAAKAAVNELNQDKLIYQYVYLKLSLDGTLTPASGSDLLANKIDEFEMANLNDKPKLKGYLSANQFVLGFYITRKSPGLKIYRYAK